MYYQVEVVRPREWPK